jgi:hypothetical protein
MDRNRAERIRADKVQGRVKPGSSVMMVPLSDPRCSLNAIHEFFNDPIESMEAMCACYGMQWHRHDRSPLQILTKALGIC